MYLNLLREMAKRGLTRVSITPAAECTYDSLKNKIKGRTDFTRPEMERIRNAHFPEHSLDYLFTWEDTKSEKKEDKP